MTEQKTGMSLKSFLFSEIVVEVSSPVLIGVLRILNVLLGCVDAVLSLLDLDIEGSELGTKIDIV